MCGRYCDHGHIIHKPLNIFNEWRRGDISESLTEYCGQSMTLNRNHICSPFPRLLVQIAVRYGEMKMTHWLGMSESVPVVRERIEEASLRLRNQRQKPPPHCVLMFNRMNDDRSFFTSLSAFLLPPLLFDPVRRGPPISNFADKGSAKTGRAKSRGSSVFFAPPES